MSEVKPFFLDSVFNWFKTNERAAWNTILIGVIICLFWLVIRLYQDRIKDKEASKQEMIREIRRAYDPKFQEIQDTINAKSSKLDTAINNVNDYLNDNKK